MRADAEYVAAAVATGEKLMQVGNVQGAFFLLSQLAGVASNNVPLQAARVRAAVMANDFAAASNTLAALAAAAPADANDLTCWLVERQKFALAYGTATRLHALYPHSIVTMVNLGTVLASMGRMDEARAILRQALQLDPLNVQATQQLDALAPGAPQQ